METALGDKNDLAGNTSVLDEPMRFGGLFERDLLGDQWIDRPRTQLVDERVEAVADPLRVASYRRAESVDRAVPAVGQHRPEA
ncbi:hypothetical protein Pma05_77380 [Plantactinospora mayteni]|uniref:Uncharacterized protein n=1 Tax=Plantactinospora mayteni TaxID=566021 RepID=A0ABQ4F2L6_9ACTN|nr:hypothetical protein Pma05_77380 [Plantactinospora mayteni]